MCAESRRKTSQDEKVNSFEVAENPSESEFPGVTRYTYFLFGVEVVSGIRD